jgi:hypothetical protein
MEQPERHQPLPSFVALPGVAWRRLGPRGRALAVVVAIGLVVAAVLAAPQIDAGKKKGAARERRAFEKSVKETRAEVTEAQRPRRGHTSATAGRGAMIAALQADITADAIARERRGDLPPPPARRTVCSRPEDLPAGTALARRHGGVLLRCISYTSERTTADGRRFGLGYEWVANVDLRRGDYTWCRTTPQAGEKFNGAELVDVPLKRACFDPKL